MSINVKYKKHKKSLPMPIIIKLLKANDTKKDKSDQRNKTQYVWRNKDKSDTRFLIRKKKSQKTVEQQKWSIFKRAKEKS